jgi:hypothetical protein
MSFYVDDLTRKAIKKYPHRAVDLMDSFDPKKIEAKEWLVQRIKRIQRKNILPQDDLKISIVGGWYGNILIPLLDMYIKYKEIHFYEIDEDAINMAKNILFKDNSKIKWKLQDATQVEFRGSQNLVINTSAEHMKVLNITSGVLAVQSNNYREIPDHINCVDSIDELKHIYNFRKVWYYDTLDYEKYSRFSVIGRV